MASSGTSSSSSTATTTSSTTYEATKARLSTSQYADHVHWDQTTAFRDCPYRQLHHQRGLMGIFRVRLLEASDLQRSYWSALALGPVKHLGFSKAHGAVSSYCQFDLDFVNHGIDEPQSDDVLLRSSPAGGSDWGDQKPAAANTKKKSNNPKSTNAMFQSPVIPTNSNPVWDNCQFECYMKKGAMRTDGQRILLTIRVNEDATAIENFLPGIPGQSDDARLLGMGSLDLTELCLGETIVGQPLPGVLDAWVSLSLPQQQQQHQQELWEQQFQLFNQNDSDPLQLKKPPPPNTNTSTGMVRVLVSYQPHGLEPQVHDVIALEAFARRNPHTNSCRPIIPPLMPLIVLERRGSYVLAEYNLDGSSSSSATTPKGQIRLHRNAVFVIERKNWVDAAHNLALLPLDVIGSTPLGQATTQMLHPIVTASRELLMPALLSLKLIWVAARTTTLASLSGVSALGQTFWNEGTGSLLHPSSSSSSSMPSDHSNHRSSHHHQDRSSATAQFVSL